MQGHLVTLTRWGDTEESYERLVAELVQNDRTHLIKRLTELARWVRQQNATVEKIAADYDKSIREAEEAEKRRIAQITRPPGKAAQLFFRRYLAVECPSRNPLRRC